MFVRRQVRSFLFLPTFASNGSLYFKTRRITPETPNDSGENAEDNSKSSDDAGANLSQQKGSAARSKNLSSAASKKYAKFLELATKKSKFNSRTNVESQEGHSADSICTDIGERPIRSSTSESKNPPQTWSAGPSTLSISSLSNYTKFLGFAIVAKDNSGQNVESKESRSTDTVNPEPKTIPSSSNHNKFSCFRIVSKNNSGKSVESEESRSTDTANPERKTANPGPKVQPQPLVHKELKGTSAKLYKAIRDCEEKCLDTQVSYQLHSIASHSSM
jgi:hypothetical protein